MKKIRRIDGKKIDEIIKVIQQCKDAELPEQDAIFMEYKAIPNATRMEHAIAHNPLYIGHRGTTKEIREIKYDLMKRHNAEVRFFNKSVKDLDMEIIGVPKTMQDLDGNVIEMVFDEIAEGVKARKAAEKCKAYYKGWKDKETRLNRMANDTTLKAKHDAKLRALQKKIRGNK